MALQHWLQLALTDGLGPILVDRLIESLGSAEAACAASSGDLRTIEGIGSKSGASIHQSLADAQAAAEGEIARCRQLGIELISKDDDRYPTALAVIPSAPPVLWMKGTLEDRDLHAVAIVGSRRCSHYGREQAERFGALLAGAGLTIVSGGARGVDSAAHRGALAHPMGRTIAVLGCGVDVVYPPENASLFKQIAERGAVISEFPLETPPLQDHFPRRNRILSGLSRGVLVVEADIRSGALITARLAADEHNRPVFALPGRVDNAMSAGPHKLIRDGAILVTKLEEILDELGPLPQTALDVKAPPPDVVAAPADVRPTPPAGQFSERQQTILAALSAEAIGVDALADATGLPVEQLFPELTMLTLRGAIRRVEGQTYARR